MCTIKIKPTKNEFPITYAKDDIVGMELFFSQYKHHIRLNAIMNNIGLEASSIDVKTILPSILKENDVETVREMIVRLSISYYENICLSHVLQMHDLIIAMVKEIPDCFAVETQGVTILVDGRKVTPAQMLYNLYSLILNRENDSKEVSDSDFDKAVELALKEYDSLTKNEVPVSIPCIKDFLLSQFIFFDLTFFKDVIISNGLMVGDFSSFLNKVGKIGKLPNSQLINEYLITYYRKLLDILISVKSELKDNPHDDTVILTKIRDAIKPINYQELDTIVQNNIVDLDVNNAINHLKGESDAYLSIWNEVKQILKYIWSKVSSMYSYYNNVYMSSVDDIKEKSLLPIKLNKKIRENCIQGVLEHSPYSIYSKDEENSLKTYYLFTNSNKESLLSFKLTKTSIIFDLANKVKKDKSLKYCLTSHSGSLTDEDICKLYLQSNSNLSVLSKNVSINKAKYKQLTNLCIELTNSLKELTEGKGIYNSLTKAWYEYEDATIFSNIDNFGYLGEILKTIEDLIELNLSNSTSPTIPTNKIDVIVSNITQRQSIPMDLDSLEEDTVELDNDVEYLLKEVNKIITMNNSLSDLVIKSPSDLRDNVFVNNYIDFLTKYVGLYRTIVNLWQEVTMDIVTPITLLSTFGISDFDIAIRKAILESNHISN